jgi:hypothetical protein
VASTKNRFQLRWQLSKIEKPASNKFGRFFPNGISFADPVWGWLVFCCGELGIRTPGGFNTSTVFKTAAIDRSANSPGSKVEHLGMNRFYVRLSCFLFRKSKPRLLENGFLRHFLWTDVSGSKGF